jgi:plasmid stabilization system protein ParE
MKRYELTSEAQNDLRQIRDFLLREAGFRATRHVMGSIIAAFHTLNANTWPGTQAQRPQLTGRASVLGGVFVSDRVSCR